MTYSKEECIEFVSYMAEIYTTEAERLDEVAKRCGLTTEEALTRKRVITMYRDTYKAILKYLEGGEDGDDRK